MQGCCNILYQITQSKMSCEWICSVVHFFIARISDCPKPLILEEDVDVAEERERIYKSEKTNDILRIRDLSKVRHFSLQNVINH